MGKVKEVEVKNPPGEPEEPAAQLAEPANPPEKPAAPQAAQLAKPQTNKSKALNMSALKKFHNQYSHEQLSQNITKAKNANQNGELSALKKLRKSHACTRNPKPNGCEYSDAQLDFGVAIEALNDLKSILHISYNHLFKMSEEYRIVESVIKNINNAKTVNDIANSLDVFTNEETSSIIGKNGFLICKMALQITMKIKQIQEQQIPDEKMINSINDKLKKISDAASLEFISMLYALYNENKKLLELFNENANSKMMLNNSEKDLKQMLESELISIYFDNGEFAQLKKIVENTILIQTSKENN